MRPLRTNEPVKDRMIPETETSVIAAIGPLNLRGEANAHESPLDKTTEDIRIDFTSRNVHECTNSLYNLPDMSDVKAWPPAVITNGTTFTARIGPTGGRRGYTRITGDYDVLLLVHQFSYSEIAIFKVHGNLCRSTFLGHRVVHQRPAHPRTHRRERTDVHVHSGGWERFR